MSKETELAVLKLLEYYGLLTLPRISELSKFSELECSSTLSNLITQGYVYRIDERFALSFYGKERLKQSGN